MTEDDQIRTIIKCYVHFTIAALICVAIVFELKTFQWFVVLANLIFFGFLAYKIYVWEKQNRPL